MSSQELITKSKGGRPVGSKNRLTEDVRKYFKMVSRRNMAKLQVIFDQTVEKDPARAWTMYMDMAEYVIPKLARVEHVGNEDKPLEMVIRWGGPQPVVSTPVSDDVVVDVEAKSLIPHTHSDE